MEIELNEERITQGALVLPTAGGCSVESETITPRLLHPPVQAWLSFSGEEWSCSLDLRLGVARLSLPPRLLKPRPLRLSGVRPATTPSPPSNSLAIDLLANLDGLRTGMVLGYQSGQLSLTTHPNGRLDRWTAEWSPAEGPLLQLGHLVAARSASGVPQPFLGLRVASNPSQYGSPSPALGALELNRPSRIRILNDQAQEVLGLTALPAGAYRLIGPTAQSHPGLLRIEIEGPDGQRQERVLPWTRSAQLLESGQTQWEWSLGANGGAFAAWGQGLNDLDSLWWIAGSRPGALTAQWVTRRIAAQLWQLELGARCPSSCQAQAGLSAQASMGRLALIQLGLNSESGGQLILSGSPLPQTSLALSLSAQQRNFQLNWTLNPRDRLSLRYIQQGSLTTVGIQWSRSLGRSVSMSASSRSEGPELQLSGQPAQAEDLGWSLRTQQRGLELGAWQQRSWGDWSVVASRPAQGSQTRLQAQLATRLWMVSDRWHLGPIGDYNLVEIETGQPGIELLDSAGQAVRADAEGVAAFTRAPAFAEVEFRPNLRSLSLTQAPPFQVLTMSLRQKRAYRVAARPSAAPQKSFRLRWEESRSLPLLRDALGSPVYLTPDGYLDLQPSHKQPLTAISEGIRQVCRPSSEDPSAVWITCESP